MEPKSMIINRAALAATTLILLACTTLSPLHAQRIWEVRKGNVRSQGNLGAGYLFQQRNVSAYVNGEMEIFFDDRFAYTGAICISVVTKKRDQVGLTANHAIFAGANYHFLKPQRWDPYLGLTPGVALVRASYKNGDKTDLSKYTLAPLASAQFGCNYYVTSFLHFFVKVQGVAGQFFSDLPTPKRIDEVKVMGGLGWNLRMWKPRVTDNWARKPKS